MKQLMRDRECEGGCGRKVGPKGARGRCSPCNAQVYRVKFIAERRLCEVPECDHLRRSPGNPHCDMHRNRVRRYGSPYHISKGYVGVETTFKWRKVTIPEQIQIRAERLAEQDVRCAICGTDDPSTTGYLQWVLDHDHRCCTGTQRMCERCIRGVLCHRCNVALGMFRDDAQMLLRAARYLNGERSG